MSLSTSAVHEKKEKKMKNIFCFCIEKFGSVLSSVYNISKPLCACVFLFVRLFH